MGRGRNGQLVKIGSCANPTDGYRVRSSGPIHCGCERSGSHTRQERAGGECVFGAGIAFSESDDGTHRPSKPRMNEESRIGTLSRRIEMSVLHSTRFVRQVLRRTGPPEALSCHRRCISPLQDE